jgi:hypothetical protein
MRTNFLVNSFRIGGLLKPLLAHNGRSQVQHMAPLWNELRSKNGPDSADSENRVDKRKRKRMQLASFHQPIYQSAPARRRKPSW